MGYTVGMARNFNYEIRKEIFDETEGYTLTSPEGVRLGWFDQREDCLVFRGQKLEAEELKLPHSNKCIKFSEISKLVIERGYQIHTSTEQCSMGFHDFMDFMEDYTAFLKEYRCWK